MGDLAGGEELPGNQTEEKMGCWWFGVKRSCDQNRLLYVYVYVYVFAVYSPSIHMAFLLYLWFSSMKQKHVGGLAMMNCP